MPVLVLQALINGLLIGGVYALYSVGFSLIFGVLGVVNIAHGEMIMLGAFITYWLFEILQIDPFLTLPFSLAGLFVLGFGLERAILRRLAGAPPIMSYILTFGLHLILANLALLAWTADPRTITTGYSGLNFKLLGASVPVVRFISCLVAVGMIGSLHLLLGRTGFGRAVRATAQDPDMARLMGVSVGRIKSLTFGLGAGVTGLAGSLVASFSPVEPVMGLPYTIIAFCVVVLGGMGHLPGAVWGGLALGVIGSLSSLLLTSGWATVITFGLLYLMLLLRPAGLTGQGAAG